MKNRSVYALSVILMLVFNTACKAEVTLQKTIRKGIQEESPALPETGPALVFKLLSAIGPEGPTIALFAAIRAEHPYASRYGGRLAGAVQVVAVDPQTGRVFHGVPERPGTAPLSPITDGKVAQQMQGDAMVDSIEAYFTVDLITCLGLPPDAEKWRVFLWLDDMVSTVKETPGITSKIDLKPFAAKAPDNQQIDLMSLSSVSDKEVQGFNPGEIRLENKRCDGKTNRVKGILRFDPETSECGWVSVLALCRDTRKMKWVTKKIPADMNKSMGVVFELDPDVWGFCNTKDEAVFMTAVCGSTVSRVQKIKNTLLN
jgi:hypothetical protein